jgi:hypothetical protein
MRGTRGCAGRVLAVAPLTIGGRLGSRSDRAGSRIRRRGEGCNRARRRRCDRAGSVPRRNCVPGQRALPATREKQAPGRLHGRGRAANEQAPQSSAQPRKRRPRAPRSPRAPSSPVATLRSSPTATSALNLSRRLLASGLQETEQADRRLDRDCCSPWRCRHRGAGPRSLPQLVQRSSHRRCAVAVAWHARETWGRLPIARPVGCPAELSFRAEALARRRSGVGSIPGSPTPPVAVW